MYLYVSICTFSLFEWKEHTPTQVTDAPRFEGRTAEDGWFQVPINLASSIFNSIMEVAASNSLLESQFHVKPVIQSG